MRRLAPVFMLAVGLGSEVSADVVKTRDGHAFEGIVVSVASDRIGLETGYGKLYFKTDVDVASVTVQDYAWPTSSGRPAPARSDKVGAWVAAHASAAGQGKGAPSPSPTQPLSSPLPTDVVPERVGQPGELAGSDMMTRFSSISENLRELSIRERKERLALVTPTWAYLVARVERTSQEPSVSSGSLLQPVKKAVIGVDLNEEWFDPRTGAHANIMLGSDQRKVYGIQGASDEDIRSWELAHLVEGGRYTIPFDVAEGLRPGDGLVWKVGFKAGDDDLIWDVSITTLKPRVQPRSK